MYYLQEDSTVQSMRSEYVPNVSALWPGGCDFRERRTSLCLLFTLLELFATTAVLTGSDSPGKEDKKPQRTSEQKHSAGNNSPNLRITVFWNCNRIQTLQASLITERKNYRSFLNVVSAFVTSNQHKLSTNLLVTYKPVIWYDSPHFYSGTSEFFFIGFYSRHSFIYQAPRNKIPWLEAEASSISVRSEVYSLTVIN